LKLEQQVRTALADENAEEGGVYVYIRRADPQESATPPLTEEDSATIVRMFRAGKASASELAKLYGKTRTTIYNVIKKETR
jgi:DNA invertase Pin-like site-specific DNA recombinase|tara:strand:+ start:3470 stop:3712 length:243 start_codon:yes stop_codon:yes gene_type:complete